MKSKREQFYNSDAWKSCRENYLKSVGGLCEICLKQGLITPAVIVHHKIHITESTLNNPAVTLNPKNLQALCIPCHNKIHFARKDRRYMVDAEGHVWAREVEGHAKTDKV